MTSQMWNSMMVIYYSTLMIYYSTILYNYCLDDYGHIQQNIDKIYTWSEVNLLQFNPAKCKYIVVSRKRSPLLPVPGLYINGTALIKVERPICHTNAYMNSFSPHIISIWNNLPHEIQSCSSLLSFKRSVITYLFV